MWWGWMAVAIVGLICLVIDKLGNRLPSNPTKRADEIERRWTAKRRAEGASWDQIYEERHIRMALARMLRVASDKALKTPRDYERIIEEAKTEQAGYLETISGKPTACKFLRIAKRLKLLDILYADALAAVSKTEGWDRPWRGKPPKHYDEDRTAAFTDLK
jgi:hypothetical protein